MVRTQTQTLCCGMLAFPAAFEPLSQAQSKTWGHGRVRHLETCNLEQSCLLPLASVALRRSSPSAGPSQNLETDWKTEVSDNVVSPKAPDCPFPFSLYPISKIRDCAQSQEEEEGRGKKETEKLPPRSKNKHNLCVPVVTAALSRTVKNGNNLHNHDVHPAEQKSTFKGLMGGGVWCSS